jgi:allantoate deiminase
VAELLLAECRTIGERQGVICHVEKTSESPAAFCSPKFIDVIEAALRTQGIVPTWLISGAGHDAMAMARVTDIGMIFVRSKGGLSHHPAEETSPEDIEKAIQVLRSVVLEMG